MTPRPADPAPPETSAPGAPGRGPAPLQGLQQLWRQLLEQVGPNKLVIGGALLVLVIGAFILPGSSQSDPFDGPGTALELMLKLGAVLALAYVSLGALKRYTAGTVSKRGSLLEVLDSTTLGPNRSVYVVRAGEKRLVLGVTQNQITPLAELAPDVPEPDPAADC